MEELLKNIPSNTFDYSEDEMKKIKSKFKTYEQIKSDMKDIKMDIKTDNEIIDNLFKRYNNNEKLMNVSEKVQMLREFESLVHQIDNALTFLVGGGYDTIIIPNIVNQTEIELRLNALLVLGAALQNNAKAKIFVFERNLGDHLIKLLSTTRITEELSAAMYVFGGLLRGFPFAQKEILPKKGLSVLLNILSDTRTDIRIKLKIIRLINDIHINTKNVDNVIAMKQFGLYDYETALESSNYCNVIIDFIKNYKTHLNRNIHDTFDILVHFNEMKLLCFDKWTESPILRHLLLILKSKYTKLYEIDNDDDIDDEYKNLSKIVNELFEGLKYEPIHELKDEL